jgi:hypothetical protein
MPSTTTGVVWLLTPSMTPCWNSHRGASDLTFEVLIAVIGENRLPDKSRLWSGQFTDSTRGCAGAEAVCRVNNAATTPSDPISRRSLMSRLLLKMNLCAQA